MPIPDMQSRDATSATSRSTRSASAGLRYPLAFADRDGVAQPTIATANVYVALPEDRKGTHMSRLVMLLEERAAPGAAPLTVASLDALLARPRRAPRRARRAASSLRSRSSCARPRRCRASRACSTTKCALTGELRDGRITKTIAVAVPVTSLCPCSKEIADYGAHNQRSTVTITVRTDASVELARAPAHRRRGGVERAVRDPEARRREVRHRARLRQSALRRGPRARRRRHGSPPTRASTASASKPRISSRSTTTRRTRGSRAGM